MREKVTFTLLAATALALLMLALAAHLQDNSPPDLMAFYTAGTQLKNGLRSEVYNESAHMEFQKILFGRSVATDVYDHPPFETVVYWALAYLPFPVAYLLWDFLNLILLGWSLYLLRPHATHFDTGSRLALTAAGLCPLISTLREGQDQILLLFACVAAFVCLKKQREFAAGAWLGAGLFRFQFVLPLLLVFVGLKKWRIILGSALIGAAFGLLSVGVMGLDGIHDYISLVLRLAKTQAFPTLVPAMPNVRGFVYLLLGRKVNPAYIAVIVAVSSLALLAWPIMKWQRRRWDPGNRAFDLFFSLAVVVSVMISYHSLINGLLVLVLPALLLLDYAGATYAHTRRRWLMMLPLILMFVATILLNVAGGNRLSVLLVPILWFAFAISREIPSEQGQVKGGERAHH
jgi:hypothetical protein